MKARAFGRQGWVRAFVVVVALGVAPDAAPHEREDDGEAEKNAGPDLVLHNGRISTVDARNSTVEAIAIKNGEIIATGRNGRVRELVRRNTQLIDLNRRRVLPGLIDGHLHGLRNGYHCFTQTVRLDNVFSRTQALGLYAAKGEKLATNTWIFTTAGWTVAQLDQPGMFTLAELDAALPANPVFIVASGAAGVHVNTRALQLLGLSSATGRLTGAGQTAAGAAVIAQLDAHSIDEQAICLADFIHAANGLGLTAWNDPEGNQQPFNTGGGWRGSGRRQNHTPARSQLGRDSRPNAR